MSLRSLHVDRSNKKLMRVRDQSKWSNRKKIDFFFEKQQINKCASLAVAVPAAIRPFLLAIFSLSFSRFVRLMIFKVKKKHTSEIIDHHETLELFLITKFFETHTQ